MSFDACFGCFAFYKKVARRQFNCWLMRPFRSAELPSNPPNHTDHTELQLGTVSKTNERLVGRVIRDQRKHCEDELMKRHGQDVFADATRRIHAGASVCSQGSVVSITGTPELPLLLRFQSEAEAKNWAEQLGLLLFLAEAHATISALSLSASPNLHSQDNAANQEEVGDDIPGLTTRKGRSTADGARKSTEPVSPNSKYEKCIEEENAEPADSCKHRCERQPRKLSEACDVNVCITHEDGDLLPWLPTLDEVEGIAAKFVATGGEIVARLHELEKRNSFEGKCKSCKPSTMDCAVRAEVDVQHKMPVVPSLLICDLPEKCEGEERSKSSSSTKTPSTQVSTMPALNDPTVCIVRQNSSPSTPSTMDSTPRPRTRPPRRNSTGSWQGCSRSSEAEKSDALDRSLARCLHHLSEQESEVEELRSAAMIVLRKLNDLGHVSHSNNQSLRRDLENLLADALEDACRRDVGGAMDVVERTGAALDRLSQLRLRCEVAVESLSSDTCEAKVKPGFCQS